MSLEAIRKSILGEAEAKAKAEQSEADSEAAKIVRDAQERAKAILTQAEDEARREEERMRLEAAAGLETERNAMVIEAKGKVIEHFLGQVREDISRRVRQEGMEKILKSSLKQFASVYPGNDFVVRTSKKNASLVKGRQKVEVASVDGFVIATPDRKIALNATVDSVVDGNMDDIRKMVADEIFSGSAGRKIEHATDAMERKSEKSMVKGKARPKKSKKAAKPAKARKIKRGR